jgi:hypothetical protein
MRRAVLLLGLGLLLGCGVKYVKFPAEAFLVDYIELRDQVRDDTYTARKRCAGDREKLAEAKRVKCAELDIKLDTWKKRDRAVLTATLAGGTIDKETLDATMGYVGPLLRLAADIAL